MKILPLGGELFLAGQTEGRTDVTKLIVAFRNFTKEPKNGGNRKRKPSAVLHNVYTKWTCIIMSVEILAEIENFQPHTRMEDII